MQALYIREHQKGTTTCVGMMGDQKQWLKIEKLDVRGGHQLPHNLCSLEERRGLNQSNPLLPMTLDCNRSKMYDVICAEITILKKQSQTYAGTERFKSAPI